MFYPQTFLEEDYSENQDAKDIPTNIVTLSDAVLYGIVLQSSDVVFIPRSYQR